MAKNIPEQQPKSEPEAEAKSKPESRKKVLHQVWFRHKTGSRKFIPGLKNSDDMEPRMTWDSIQYGSKTVPVLRHDPAHIVKVTLHDEAVDIMLTPHEQKLPEKVQERILDRRAQEADFKFQANAHLRRVLEKYEDSGDIEIIEHNKEVVVGSPEATGSVIAELSDVALAYYAEKGLDVPAHLMPKKVAAE